MKLWYSAFRQKFPKLLPSAAHSFLQQIAQNKNWANPKDTTLARIYSGISFFCSKLCLKKSPLLLVRSTSNFTWSLSRRTFSSWVIYFANFFFVSKIFVKLLFIWVGLEVFPVKLLGKEACHRVQHVKISRNWSLSFIGRLCACLKNQTLRGWEMENCKRWSCTWRREACEARAFISDRHLATETATGEMIFPDPRFP